MNQWRTKGSIHIDIAEVQTAEGKLYLFVGIDRTSKFAVAQLVATADRKTDWEFLQLRLEAVPYQIHTMLADRDIGSPSVRETMARGIQFAEQPRNRNTIYSQRMRFDMTCEAIGIEHRLTKPNHPWSREDQKTVRGTVFLSGGQVDRMSRAIKDATVRSFHDENHDELRKHLADYWRPTTSPAGSRPSAASRHTNTSAKSGNQSQMDSPLIRST